MKPSPVKIIISEIYGFAFALAVGHSDFRKVQSKLKAQGWKNLDLSSMSLGEALGEVSPIVSREKGKDDRSEPLAIMHFRGDKITHNLVAHESAHLVMCLCQHANIKTDYQNQEPIAYLQGWVANEIYRALKSWGIRVTVE